MAKMDLSDVKYDALLTNRRPLADPDVVRVQPGTTVRLRIIAASSDTNFFIATDKLETHAIAINGEDITPLSGNRFELVVAQRLDLHVKIPTDEGAYPILAQGEGTDLQTGLVLVTANAALPALSQKVDTVAGALTNAQEQRFGGARSLPAKAVDRTLQVTLNGDMASYSWGLSGRSWPTITPLEFTQGERVGTSSPIRPACPILYTCTATSSRSPGSMARHFPAPRGIQS
jgi:FtsP/CotA-like multicopper oxidase with cupredoxin domain